jgi:hypothetical protein
MDGGYGGRDDSVGVGSCTGISPISSTLNLGLVHIARAQPSGRRSHARHSEEGLQRRLVRIRARQSNTASQPSEQTGRSIPVRLERISRRCNPSSLGRAPPMAPSSRPRSGMASGRKRLGPQPGVLAESINRKSPWGGSPKKKNPRSLSTSGASLFRAWQ